MKLKDNIVYNDLSTTLSTLSKDKSITKFLNKKASYEAIANKTNVSALPIKISSLKMISPNENIF